MLKNGAYGYYLIIEKYSLFDYESTFFVHRHPTFVLENVQCIICQQKKSSLVGGGASVDGDKMIVENSEIEQQKMTLRKHQNCILIVLFLNGRIMEIEELT